MSKSFDPNTIRRQFPFFTAQPEWAYLDSAATALKSQSVIDAEDEYYRMYSANIKRGVYRLASQATDAYEAARQEVASLLHAKNANEVIFTGNATEAINLVMYALGTEIVESGSRIATTIMEHHANFVPWQQLAISKNASLTIVDVTDAYELDLLQKKNNDYDLTSVIDKNTRILALSHVSNVLGTVNPLKEIIRCARRINPSIIVVVDGAQAVPHLDVDVVDLDCDFYAFSGHKIFGPTGVGVLWGKEDVLRGMKPFQYGGEMIEQVGLDKSTFAAAPERYEAGTPAIAQAIGLGAAVRFFRSLPKSARTHVGELTQFAVEELKKRDARVFISASGDETGIVSFELPGVHAHDIASVCDEQSIAIRAGHHCAMPLHERLGVVASSRISLQVYNTRAEIERFLRAIDSAKGLFT